MIQAREFTGCCNAMILFDFGGTKASLFRGRAQHDEDMRKDLKDMIDRFGFKLLVATTNNQQTKANEILAEFGFKRTEFMRKYIHPETTFALWWREPDFNEDLLKNILRDHQTAVLRRCDDEPNN